MYAFPLPGLLRIQMAIGISIGAFVGLGFYWHYYNQVKKYMKQLEEIRQ